MPMRSITLTELTYKALINVKKIDLIRETRYTSPDIIPEYCIAHAPFSLRGQHAYNIRLIKVTDFKLISRTSDGVYSYRITLEDCGGLTEI